MKKGAYLALTVVCILTSLKGISAVVYGVLERGFGGVNYGQLIPVCIAIWSFIQWKNA